MILPSPGRRARALYLWGVVLAGMIAIADSFEQLSTSHVGFQWLILAALTVIGSSATIRIRSVNSTISVSETFVFASVLLFGQAAGTLTVALDALVISIWFGRQGGIERLLFNTTAAALSLWTGAFVFFRMIGERPLALEPAGAIGGMLLATLALTLIYFLLNTWLVSFAVAFEKRLSPYRIWRRNFAWLSVTYLAGAALAVLFVGYSNRLNIWYLTVLVVVVAAFYFTFRGAVGQTEDAIRHLEDLNRLHLSTVEALAAAVDAKDQTTHGHIRRVQELAVGLARSVGVTDEDQINAIRAAALLHDLGKLAVPDHILNKPGRLTDRELETMKLHAGAGADILSSIEFPYPVVPVVRHHHENWNGSGYPDGLRGEAIPIGARILAVVDCYDALTSDRPYRRRLSSEAALEIIRERRGVMYDPRIVGAFLDLKPASGDADVAEPSASYATLKKMREASRQWPAGSDTAEARVVTSLTADAVRTLYSLGRELSSTIARSDAAAIVAAAARRLVPAALCVFYDYDARSETLTAVAASGDDGPLLGGLRMPVGERLSGWVAANRRPMVNADPMLDLHDTAAAKLPLKSCLSLPLLSNGQLLAVLTLYADVESAFEGSQQALLELVGPEVAEALARAPHQP